MGESVSATCMGLWSPVEGFRTYEIQRGNYNVLKHLAERIGFKLIYEKNEKCGSISEFNTSIYIISIYF